MEHRCLESGQLITSIPARDRVAKAALVNKSLPPNKVGGNIREERLLYRKLVLLGERGCMRNFSRWNFVLIDFCIKSKYFQIAEITIKILEGSSMLLALGERHHAGRAE